MDPARISRATAALAFVAVLVGGAFLGSMVTTIASREQPSPIATPLPSPAPSAHALPAADVDGEDFERLPRYPDSVRTEFNITSDDHFRLTAVEYFADADLGEVRSFYQDVIADQGWQRADITYAGGEWTYVIVDGGTEALIELEISGGFVEVDLQVSTPLPSETPPPTAQPTAVPTPVPPAPPPPGDDDGDDDDDDSDDGDDDSYD